MSRFTGFTDQERGVLKEALQIQRQDCRDRVSGLEALKPEDQTTRWLERKLQAQIALKVTKELLAELETGEKK